jgi:hypothetical protein
MRRTAAWSVVLACLSLSQGTAAAPGAAVPILVELFTAEGCSSCPAADVLLEKMIESQPATGVELVGLGEHVDYWDNLGWKDRFSSAKLTVRQQGYAARFKTGEVYTPQMIVDGREAFVGNDLNAARRAIETASALPHGVIHVAIETSTGNTLTVSVSADQLPPFTAGDHVDILVAIIEDHLRTEVKRGENQGRTLTHAAVVRTLQTIGEASGAASAPSRARLTLPSDWRRDSLKIVAFAQERGSRRVLATAALAVAAPQAAP